ncbi:longitudinals lacking protein, isoforms A/B/D/L isoform X2 [Daphnia magna]|uniref:longitudinals lacking protein, isoforms A/B/D/L isoform X2 n=1 Tax=Daphnia magna TaxID=35525 RepID=UPI001E1BB4BC|nr:longitudinals lacking protein, isoforms A/B/D/L isoform X2 [Daphnia magna]
MENDLREFCLKWNNHHNTLISVLDSLLMKERLVDVTLAAEGQFINVHRIVLFACSQYFEELLSQLPDKQAVIFLKDVKFADLKALVDYMYRGEVNVTQDRLEIFLQMADSLKIKGLVDQQQLKKFTVSFPEVFSPSNVKAKMNGPKMSQILSEPYPTSGNRGDSINSPSNPRSFLSSSIQMMGASFNNNEEENEQQHLREDGSEENGEDLEPGVMVAEMEPDDNFVPVLADQGENIDSEFGDDHFEATENWPSQHVEDEFWNNSQDGFNTLLGVAYSDEGTDTWTSTPNVTAGPSKHKRTKKKSLSSEASLSSSTAKGNNDRPINCGSDEQLRYKEQTLPITVDGAQHEGSLNMCPCGRSYTKRKNYVRHITFECGKEASFACRYKNCRSRFKRKDNLKVHMDRVHLGDRHSMTTLPDAGLTIPSSPVLAVCEKV